MQSEALENLRKLQAIAGLEQSTFEDIEQAAYQKENKKDLKEDLKQMLSKIEVKVTKKVDALVSKLDQRLKPLQQVENTI